MSDKPSVLERTRTRPKRCPACGLRGWRLDLDERCDTCNPCCEEHFPSEAMTPEEQAAHVCPACSWEANPEWLAEHFDEEKAINDG